MTPEAIWTIAVGAVAALAATGAWVAAASANRFEQSWVIDPREGVPGQYLLRNNTKRRAELIETEPTPLYPERPDEPPKFHLDAPANANLAHGETIGFRARNTRGVIIQWRRKIFWFERTYRREFTLPLRYA